VAKIVLRVCDFRVGNQRLLAQFDVGLAIQADTQAANAVSVASPSSWFDIPGSQSETNLSITINPALPEVFYRLRLP